MTKYMKEMFVAAAAFFATSAGPMAAPAQAGSAIPFEMIEAATKQAQQDVAPFGKFAGSFQDKYGLEVTNYEDAKVQSVCGQGGAFALTVKTGDGLVAYVDESGNGNGRHLVVETKEDASVKDVHSTSRFKQAADQYCRMKNGLAPAARGHMVKALLQAAQNGTLSIAPAP